LHSLELLLALEDSGVSALANCTVRKLLVVLAREDRGGVHNVISSGPTHRFRARSNWSDRTDASSVLSPAVRHIQTDVSGPTHPWPKFEPGLRWPGQRARPTVSSLGHLGLSRQRPINSWPIPLAKLFSRPLPPFFRAMPASTAVVAGAAEAATTSHRWQAASTCSTVGTNSGQRRTCEVLGTHLCPLPTTCSTIHLGRYVGRSSQLPA
jgi:hypothetical protein